MVLLQDGLIAFFSAVGVTAVVWMAAGALPSSSASPKRPICPAMLSRRDWLMLSSTAPAMSSSARRL